MLRKGSRMNYYSLLFLLAIGIFSPLYPLTLEEQEIRSFFESHSKLKAQPMRDALLVVIAARLKVLNRQDLEWGFCCCDEYIPISFDDYKRFSDGENDEVIKEFNDEVLKPYVDFINEKPLNEYTKNAARREEMYYHETMESLLTQRVGMPTPTKSCTIL